MTTAPVSRWPSVLAAVAAGGRRIAALAAAERARWVLWAPVLVGSGIGVYFALPDEPPHWLAGVLAAAAALAGLAAVAGARRARPWSVAVVALGLIALGFAVAQARTARLATAMLAERTGPLTVEGAVVAVEAFEDGVRIVLAVHGNVPGLEAKREAAERDAGTRAPRLRLRLRVAQPAIQPGARLRVRAVLSPPPPPPAPGAFDFQRQAFFAGLSAVGFSVGRAEILDPTDASAAGVRLWLERLRTDVAARIRAQVPGVPGAIIVALVTGERTAIPPEVMAAIRDAGLAHLLAISGLHVGLVAACVFAVLRGGLALVPRLALFWPIKKWAVIGALAAAGFYTALAGASVPTVRAFVMLAVVSLAVLVDRQGISMRLVAWSALAILLVRPEALLGPSFQLSFAAVIALVATYEELRRRQPWAGERPRPWRRIPLYLAATALTTVVATLATTPFAVYHFNRMTWYGVIANLIAVPANALWVMPWGIAAMVLMPLGLEHLALTPMAWGAALTAWTARTVADWPGAVSLVPVVPTAALVAFALGGLWLCLWAGRWRWWGLAVCALAAVPIALDRPPDVLIDGQGTLVAVRGADDRLVVSSRRAGRASREAWLRRAGEEGDGAPWPELGDSADGRLACDPAGCIYRARGRVVALARSLEAIDDDCRRADVLVSVVPVRGRCPSAARVIDRFDLWRGGAHALWLADDGIRVESVNAVRGRRPWVVAPRPRRAGRGGPSSGEPAPPDDPAP